MSDISKISRLCSGGTSLVNYLEASRKGSPIIRGKARTELKEWEGFYLFPSAPLAWGVWVGEMNCYTGLGLWLCSLGFCNPQKSQCIHVRFLSLKSTLDSKHNHYVVKLNPMPGCICPK